MEIRCTRCGHDGPLIPVADMAAHLWQAHGLLEVRWGYTLADLQHAAHWAVRNLRGWWAGDRRDLIAVAYDGVVDRVLTAEHWPNRYDLHAAAETALNAYRNSERSTYGINAAGEHYSTPRWIKYWLGQPSATPSHEDRIVDRLTLPALVASLTVRQRQVITAMAATDNDRSTARDLLGMREFTFNDALNKARGRCALLWHEHETPYRPEAKRLADRRPVPSGAAPCGTRAAAVRHRNRGESVCQDCLEAERSYSAQRRRDHAGNTDRTVRDEPVVLLDQATSR